MVAQYLAAIFEKEPHARDCDFLVTELSVGSGIYTCDCSCDRDDRAWKRVERSLYEATNEVIRSAARETNEELRRTADAVRAFENVLERAACDHPDDCDHPDCRAAESF